MTISRRALFGLAAGAVAAPVVARLPDCSVPQPIVVGMDLGSVEGDATVIRSGKNLIAMWDRRLSDAELENLYAVLGGDYRPSAFRVIRDLGLAEDLRLVVEPMPVHIAVSPS